MRITRQQADLLKTISERRVTTDEFERDAPQKRLAKNLMWNGLIALSDGHQLLTLTPKGWLCLYTYWRDPHTKPAQQQERTP